MTCATLTSDDVRLFAELVAALAIAFGGLGCVGGWVFAHASEWLIGRFRKRGAAAPFAERAKRLQERRERSVQALARIVQRNRQEALRRGQGVE